MKRLLCMGCGRAMTNDEIAFILHLHGGAATRFVCMDCLAQEYGCERPFLEKKVELLKQSGCRYFSETYVQ